VSVKEGNGSHEEKKPDYIPSSAWHFEYASTFDAYSGFDSVSREIYRELETSIKSIVLNKDRKKQMGMSVLSALASVWQRFDRILSAFEKNDKSWGSGTYKRSICQKWGFSYEKVISDAVEREKFLKSLRAAKEICEDQMRSLAKAFEIEIPYDKSKLTTSLLKAENLRMMIEDFREQCLKQKISEL
jgi:hypothetical protein